MNMKYFILSAAAFFLSATAMAGDIYYVKADGNDGDGKSWENAKSTLAAAHTAATSGDIIFVAQGTYMLTAALTMTEGVNVYGGFAGNETSLAQRPTLVYGKTASGNASVLEANASSRVLTQSGEFSTETIWDGFVIKNGQSAGDGGGVYLSSNGVLNNVTLTNNVATGNGGGIYANYYSKVTNCLIINNKSTQEGGGLAAGRANSRTTVINCLIVNNTANNGGGISCQFADIINCTIANNHATGNGGGIYAYSNAPTVTNCIVWNNTRTASGTKEGAQINGSDGNTHLNSSYFATLGAYGGQGSNRMTLAATNTGEGTANYPAFANPATIIGYVTEEDQIAAIFAADWRLTVNSACKDAGTPDASTLNLPETDLIRNTRIINGRIDMGAFETPLNDFVINPGDSKSYSDYVNASGYYGDIIIQSTETATGQLTGIPDGDIEVNGIIKLLKTFTPEQWYPMGFPFEPAHVTGDFSETTNSHIPPDYDLAVYDGENRGDFWVKQYNSDFVYSPQIAEKTGYIFRFPDAFADVEVSFISEPKCILENATLEAAIASENLNNGYNLLTNTSLSDWQTTENACYLYNPTSNCFEMAEAGTSIKPFESFIVAKPGTMSLVRSIAVDSGITSITPAAKDDDPVIAAHYYNLQGEKVQRPAEKGIYIVKEIHASQKVTAKKVIY
jgi:parallel beta-helix repeat protein/predicted outer membrane repeat protein